MKYRIIMPKRLAAWFVVFTCLTMMAYAFPASSLVAKPAAQQSAETVRIKMVDLYTGAPLTNQRFNLLIPLVDDRVGDTNIQRTQQEYQTDAAGFAMIPTPQFKYGSGIVQQFDVVIERLPDGSWVGKTLPLRGDLKIKAGLAALSSPDLTTRFVAGFNLWALEINTGENKFTKSEQQWLNTYERKINQAFFDSAVAYLKTGNKGLRRDIFSYVAMVLSIVNLEVKMTGSDAQPKPVIKALLNKVKLPSSVIAGVIENLRDPDNNIRLVMLRVLAVNPGTPASATIEAIKPLLNDDDGDVRTLARKTLDEWKVK